MSVSRGRRKICTEGFHCMGKAGVLVEYGHALIVIENPWKFYKQRPRRQFLNRGKYMELYYLHGMP